MKVLCIFPVIKNEDKIPSILEKFHEKIGNGLCSFGAINPEIKCPSGDYIYVPTNQSLVLIGPPKGKGILDCIKNVSKSPDFVIVCDGSGKIPYEYVTDIFQQLTSDSSMCCVMANRGINKAISPFRWLIERFEIFISKEYHNHKKEVPDGQCGLWGYRYGKLRFNEHEKEIKLTGKGYEIELDLLNELMEKDLGYSFIDIELPDKKKIESSFEDKDLISKIRFLIQKYEQFKFCTSANIEKFEKSEEFRSLTKESDIKKDWEKYKIELLNLIK